MKDDIVMVPYIIAESTADRYDKINKRLWIIIILLIILLTGSNALWLWYESQWEYIETTESVEQEIDADGDFTVIGIGNNYGKR